MLKIENVLNTSFDVLMDGIFENSHRKQTNNSSQVLNNLGEYIEIYTEKKRLEEKKNRLDALLYVKDAVIDDLQEKISEQSAKKIELIKEREHAVNENKSKSLELAKTSHEIRTPISGILGTTQLLLDTDLTAEQKKLIRLIERNSESLLELINDILDYSKIKSGELKIEQTPINLQKITEEVVEILNYHAEERNNQLHIRIFGGIPDRVLGDPLRMKQVLLNLTGNAVKFTKNGRVSIRTSLVKKTGEKIVVKFEVSDTGIGIPPEKISCLFKTFSQVSAGVTEKFRGTGLGLAISKELVEKMGGEIGVESELDEGTTFWFTLPLGRLQTNDSDDPKTSELTNGKRLRRSKPRNPGARTKNIRILLVEDDEVNQKVNALLLEKWGYQVDIAENGQEAISQLELKPYDIVLMDIHMPVLDGLEATKRIRSQRQHLKSSNIPIIAMTASALEEDKEVCLEAGMDDYIVKPFNLEDLENKIDQHISRASTETNQKQPESENLQVEPIRPEDLKQLQDDTLEEFEPLVELFLNQLPKRMVKIRSAGKKRDCAELKAAAHQLRGSASSFYAERMVEICSRLEKFDSSEIHQLADPLISQLESEASAVFKYLTSVLNGSNEQFDL